MADGQVLIDSKMDTGGVTKGANKIEKEFDQLAKITKRTAQIMEQQLKNVDLEGLADGMSDSFETEGKQVEQSVEQTADTVEKAQNRWRMPWRNLLTISQIPCEKRGIKQKTKRSPGRGKS